MAMSLRVARREAARAKGRSALVVAMIAVPVAALAFGAVSFDTLTLSPDEQAGRLMGTADAALVWPTDGQVYQVPDDFVFSGDPPARPAGTEAELLALLPAGTRLMSDQTGSLTVRTAAGLGAVGTRMLDYADPLAAGMLRQLAGRAPAAPDEVVLTPAAAERLGAGVGATVRAEGRELRVVGTVEDPTDLSAATIVLRPGALPPADRQHLRWLAATPQPVAWAEVKRLNTKGVVAVSRHVLANPPPAAERYADIFAGKELPAAALAVLVGGLAMLEIVLLAGPAFAVGARRRRRDLAVLAANGGKPAQLRRIVLADGVVLGAVAAVAGIALGILAAWLAMPALEMLGKSPQRAGAFGVFPAALAAIAGLAMLTGVLAALVPAWIAARQDVVSALAGRRGITRSRRRWVLLGIVLGAAGAGLAGYGAVRISTPTILSGLAIGELGLVLCTPALVGLVARAGRWLPPAARIALRDTSRNRTAAAPAISAVMAAVVGSLAIGVVLAANTERSRDGYRASGHPGDVAIFHGNFREPGARPLAPAAEATVRRILPVASLHEVGLPYCGAHRCEVIAQLPEARRCPYTVDFQHEPTRPQQRAARADPRCAGVGQRTAYFGGHFSTVGMTLIIEPDAAGAAVAIAAEDTAVAQAALRAGRVVVDDPGYLEDGRVTLAVRDVQMVAPGQGRLGEARTVTAPAVALPHRPRVPITMMTRATAASLGLDYTTYLTLAATTRMPTVAEEDALRAALGGEIGLYVERGAPEPNTRILLILAIVAGVITLAAAAIATGLAAADGRADLATLAAVGASPRVRRLLSLSQSGVIAGLGSLLGAVAGLGASIAVLYALNQRFAAVWPEPTPYPIRVPWLNLAVALIAVPLVAMLGAGLLTRSRLPIEKRL